MLTWPAIQQLLFQALPSNIGDLKGLEQDGPAFIIQIQEGTPKLALDDSLQDRPVLAMQSQASRTSGGARDTFPRHISPVNTMPQLPSAHSPYAFKKLLIGNVTWCH
jgi:hypothetical protein